MAIMDTSSRPPILPEKGKRNILITSALPYVNNVPHLGNIVGSVLSADAYARFSRLRNRPTLYICGTDEYGTATEAKALEDGVTPQELCDKYHDLHAKVYKWFDISFDYFGRTTTAEQKEIAQHIFLKLNENGYFKEQNTTQPYCEKHSSFLADRFVEGQCPNCGYADARGDQCEMCSKLLDPFDLLNPRCKLDGASPVPRTTTHVHILLDKLQPALEEWFAEASKNGAWSSNGRIITESWLKEGLRDRSITRDIKWGTPVPLPGYEDKVLYVWFDACIGYVSITANYTREWERWWRDPENVSLYQFLGKDNVPFHTVIFPASQIGTGEKWTKLHHLSATEYLNYESGKFSKSRSIGVFGDSAKETGVPADVWRYYLLSSRPETGDSQFEWKMFIKKNNSELLANLGNFVNRLVKFTGAKYNSQIPDYRAVLESPAAQQETQTPSTESSEPDPTTFKTFVTDVSTMLTAYVADMEAVNLRSGLGKAMALAARGNLFLQQNRLDNALLASHPQHAAGVVGLGLNLVYLLASCIGPFMPASASSILQQLGSPPQLPLPDAEGTGAGWSADNHFLPVGHQIGKAAYLFTRIDEKKEDEWREMFGGLQAKKLKAEEAAKKAAQKEARRKREAEKKARVAAAAAEKVKVEGDDDAAAAESTPPPPAAKSLAAEKGFGQLNVAD
jgi:methionyl-tRNA synthetase